MGYNSYFRIMIFQKKKNEKIEPTEKSAKQFCWLPFFLVRQLLMEGILFLNVQINSSYLLHHVVEIEIYVTKSLF